MTSPIPALIQFYERELPPSDDVVEGWYSQEIMYELVIEADLSASIVHKPQMMSVPGRLPRFALSRQSNSYDDVNSLVDKVRYVLGYGADKLEGKNRASYCNEIFRNDIRRILAHTQDAEARRALITIIAFYEAPEWETRRDRLVADVIEAGRTNKDKQLGQADPDKVMEALTHRWIAIRVNSVDSERCIHFHPGLRSYFSPPKEGQFFCVGYEKLMPGQPEKKHVNLTFRGLRMKMVAYDDASPAFRAWDMNAEAMTPMSQAAISAYSQALAYLWSQHPDNPRWLRHATQLDPIKKGSRSDGKLLCLYWSSLPTKTFDPRPSVFEEIRPEDQITNVRTMFAISKHEYPIPEFDDEHLYLLVLKIRKGRISVHRFTHGTIGEIRAAAWRYDTDVMYDKYQRRPRLWLIQKALGVDDADLLMELIHTSLFGQWHEGVPYALLSIALDRLKLPAVAPSDRWVIAAVIKAILRAQGRRTNNRLLENLTMQFDETNPSVPYRYGACFALVESLQRKAYGRDINRPVAKLLEGALTHPHQTLIDLAQRADVYLQEASPNNRGLSIFLRNKFSELAANMKVPKQWTLEDQAMLVIGRESMLVPDKKEAEEDPSADDGSVGTSSEDGVDDDQ